MSLNLAVQAARKAVELSQEALQVDLFGPGAVSPERLAWLRDNGFLPAFPAGVGVPLPSGGVIDPWGMALFMALLLSQASRRRARQMHRWPLETWAEHVDEHIERERVRRQQEPPAARDAPRPPREVVIPEVVDPVARQRPVEVVDTYETRGPMPVGHAPPPASTPSSGHRPPAPPLPPSGGGGSSGAGGPMIPAPPPGLGPIHTEAWIQARTRAGEYARGLGNQVSAEMETLVAEVWTEEAVTGPVDEELRLRTVEAIREETADAIAHGRTADELARRLAHRTGDWARDWKRIAVTELQGAYSDGVVIDAIRYDGEDARIARIPEPNACRNCRRAFLDDNGRPRIFTARELMDNGTNVGKPADQWRPTIWPLHPNCVCGTERVPRGLTYNDDWELTPERSAV
jgi:hypothetical protein